MTAPHTVAGHTAGVELPEGMVPWHGGDRAPVDWDGGPALFRDGVRAEYFSSGWDWQHYPDDPPEVRAVEIVAYTLATAARQSNDMEGEGR